MAQPIERTRKKLVMVGDGGCGKTSLLMVYSGLPFPEEYVPTIFENYIKKIPLSKSRVLEFSLWDTAGQEDYDRIRPLSYPDTDVACICFDVNLASFDPITTKWLPEVRHFLPETPIILVACKTDMRTERSITFDEGMKFAQKIKAVKYIETSAKQNIGVTELFQLAAKYALKPKRAMQRPCKFL